MRRNHNSVLGVILAVIVGLCLLPSSAFSTSTVLNQFISEVPPGGPYYGNFGTVILDVKPGEAHFTYVENGDIDKIDWFFFTTSLTLYPENFMGVVFVIPPVDPGTPLSGGIYLSGFGVGDFEIINPNIVSEDQFGDQYWLRLKYLAGLGENLKSGIATNEVPEPSTMLLLGSGLIGLAGYGRRKFFKK